MSDISFNILDWYQGDEYCTEEECKSYVIRLFGRTQDDKSVSLKIEGYKPYFYIEIPNNWDQQLVERFVAKLRTSCSKKKEMDDIIKYEIVERHKYYYFTAGKPFKFIRFVFNNSVMMKNFSYVFTYDIDMRGIEKYKTNQNQQTLYQNRHHIDWCAVDFPKHFHTK